MIVLRVIAALHYRNTALVADGGVGGKVRDDSLTSCRPSTRRKHFAKLVAGGSEQPNREAGNLRFPLSDGGCNRIRGHTGGARPYQALYWPRRRSRPVT